MAKIICLYTLLDIMRMISKTTAYINEFNENKNTMIMSLRVNDEQLFKKYSKIWKKN